MEPRFYFKFLFLSLIIEINKHFLFHYWFDNLMSSGQEDTTLLSLPWLFLCFSYWVGPAKLLKVYSGELHSVRVHTWCNVAHFAQQIQHKSSNSEISPEVHQHQSLFQVLMKILPAYSSCNWTNFFQSHRSGIFFQLCDFIKVSHRLEAKFPGSPPARPWSESHTHLKYPLNKTILILHSVSMGGQEMMS